jgi:4-diphosphocytidyl-2-C-methyl-D-erythritol kinase
VDKISLKAPAKINLYLKVLGKRDDGYHEIESLVQAIDLYDEISIEKSDVLELECNDPSLGTDESNLALRAALLLRQRVYFPGARIVLDKKIPIGSGLGGGSSDAAFVIRGLCQLYGLVLSAREKMDIAGEIGSDVPFFLSGGQAIMTGRGEKLFSVRLPVDYFIVVIVHPITSSTREAYGNLKIDLTKKNKPSLLKRKIEPSSFYRKLNLFVNDLEEVVSRNIPELGQLRNFLVRSGGIFSSMTGSGSAVFGIFRSNMQNDFRLSGEFGRDYRVYFCRPILLPPEY